MIPCRYSRIEVGVEIASALDVTVLDLIMTARAFTQV